MITARKVRIIWQIGVMILNKGNNPANLLRIKPIAKFINIHQVKSEFCFHKLPFFEFDSCNSFINNQINTKPAQWFVHNNTYE